MGSGFGYGERYGMTKHHYQGCVAFNKGAFHESVFDKVGEVLVYVESHVNRRQNNAYCIFHFAWSCDDVFVYGYSSVFAGEPVDSYDAAILVFRVGWPGNGGCGSLSNDLYDVSSRYAKFLHGSLVDSCYASSHVALSGVSNSKLHFTHGFSLLM